MHHRVGVRCGARGDRLPPPACNRLCCPDAQRFHRAAAARPLLGRALSAAAGHRLSPGLARFPRAPVLPALGRALRLVFAGARAAAGVAACGLGGRGQRRRAGGQCAARAAPGHPLGDHHHHPDRFGAGARAVGRRARSCVSALRRARQRRPFPAALPPQPGADPGNRAVAEHAVRLPRPRHSRVRAQCAAVGAFVARLPAAAAVDRARAAHRHLRGGAVAGGCRALRRAGRACRAGARVGQPEVRHRRACALAGGRRRVPRARAGDASGVDRRQYPRRRGSGGDRDAPAAAPAVAGPAAAVGAAASGALRQGRGAGARPGLACGHAPPAAVAGHRGCGVRDRYAGRADGVLCVCPGGLRRRQPAADRRPQPAGAGGGRHAVGDRPAPA
ncbi:hypothetical protein NB689_003494 [Xanthomonas sacchari]|nr:hypothetical protein [Xanthomonas sacchari]